MRRGLLATREELSALRTRVGRRPFDQMYEALRKRCAMILQARPITETDWRTQYAQGVFGAALTAARTSQGRLFDLLICHHIDRNVAYRDRAVEEIKNLASWSVWTDPSHASQRADLCTGECCATMAIALDWLADDLSPTDMNRCLTALRDKGLSPYRQAVTDGVWWYNCYHNWNAVVNGGCGLAALALSDEDPSAAETLNVAREGLRHFFDALGREGGWDEGLGYWGYAMRYVLLLGEAVDRQLGDREIFMQRGMEETGLFGVYFSPRGHSANFGDALSAVPLYGALYGLAKHFNRPEVAWWLDRYAFHRDVSITGWSDIGLALLLRPEDLPVDATPTMDPLRVYQEIGWAALADHWPEPALYVAVKTGDLSANHSQMDMNSIQLQVDGEMLLTDPGNPPLTSAYISDERYDFYEAQARAHNTIVLADREYRIDAHGQIVDSRTADDFRWVVADAGNALGDNVRFHRHVIMLVDEKTSSGHTVVVLDELTNAAAETMEAYWHSFGEIELAKDGQSGMIIGRQSDLNFRVLSDASVACGINRRKVGKNTDSALTITIPATRNLLLLSVFSRRSLDEVAIRQSRQRQIVAQIGDIKINFQGSRRHLTLESISR